MAAYCTAARLPFNPRALSWEPGERAEWQRSAVWHSDASSSSGFEGRERKYRYTVENCEKLARYAAHHRPFYEQLYAQRVDVTPWECPTADGSADDFSSGTESDPERVKRWPE
jgi:hypothetical protein